MPSRRRFLQLVASASLTPGVSLVSGAALAASPSALVWEGVAMGGDVSITLDGFARDAGEDLLVRARQELTRAEQVFSLYDEGSAVSHLNARGALTSPPSELLEMMQLASELHGMTGGAFDPTVLSPAGPAARRATSWRDVEWRNDRISLPQGATLTFNGVAQGFATDRVCDLFKAAGAAHALVNLGEYRATGPKADGTAWVLGLRDADALWRTNGRVQLRQGALATSSNATPSGAHILDPRTRQPVHQYKSVSVVAPTAALADGLSTALYVMPLDAALSLVEDTETVAARFTLANGEIVASARWQAYAI